MTWGTSTRSARALGLATALFLVAPAWAADVVVVEDWTKLTLGAKGVPDGWTSGQSWGLPKHDFTVEEDNGHRVLHLRSEGDSSMITKEVKVNLKATPILEWRWRVVTLPKGADARSKHTDDQAAQLYVVCSSSHSSRRGPGGPACPGSSATSGTRRPPRASS